MQFPPMLYIDVKFREREKRDVICKDKTLIQPEIQKMKMQTDPLSFFFSTITKMTFLSRRSHWKRILINDMMEGEPNNVNKEKKKRRRKYYESAFHPIHN